MMIGVVKKWGINGEGIVYNNRKAVFVPGAVPGETVEYSITEDLETYARGHLEKVIEASPRRRPPMCRHAEACGGCSLMHVDSKGQVRMKEQILADALRKYAGYTGRILPLVKNPDALAYRNACKLPFGEKNGHLASGMFESGSNHFVALERCLIHSKKLEEARVHIDAFLDAHGFHAAQGKISSGLKTLVLKEYDGKVYAVLITQNLQISKELAEEMMEKTENLAGVWQSERPASLPDYELFGPQIIHLAGAERMELHLDGYTLDLLPRSFFQLNTAQALNLYKTVAEWVPEHSSLIVEAYSGIGAISLFVSDKAEEVIGIESIGDAVKNAAQNAEINHRDNLSFLCGDAGKELQKITKERKVDVLIVDPPRSGLDETMIQTILKTKPESMIYVSCNPATLGKNLAVLQREYEIKKVQPFDMFSQTAHVESITLLQRKTGRTGRKPGAVKKPYRKAASKRVDQR